MALAVAAGCLAGCQAIVSRPEPRLAGPQVPPPFGEAVPTEKDKSTLPTYVIEPPDILFIEALRVVPKPPYHIQATDVVSIDMELGARGRGARPAARQPLRGQRQRHVESGLAATARSTSAA